MLSTSGDNLGFGDYKAPTEAPVPIYILGSMMVTKKNKLKKTSELSIAMNKLEMAKAKGGCLKANLPFDGFNTFLSFDGLDHDLFDFCGLCTRVGFGLALEEIKERFSNLDFDKDSFNLYDQSVTTDLATEMENKFRAPRT
ncbi:hypothetical protein ACH5RR_041170 [Cinchona calisaya]|uniref:Uncharacterized protein n=1 Tax=Cinchona calisaya TaxID=153742 RepID=A0ABD2XY87_9GENT